MMKPKKVFSGACESPGGCGVDCATVLLSYAGGPYIASARDFTFLNGPQHSEFKNRDDIHKVTRYCSEPTNVAALMQKMGEARFAFGA
jgi:hypothetical protein